ncbi:MAG: 2,4-dihydroxyhept-2-ene-1,7-dioic acid aldolase [Candidatus Omnitrophica bacterium]|nr:2,4-dihydroxyhept-2-ene-1,7-dioic acid aldolase [Candidatus Omnitrophota bacterium]
MNLKKKLRKPKATIGSWITLPDCSVAEIMAKQGFDWLVIDMEHSAIEISQAQELIRVIELSGCVPLVRVGENNPNLIKRIMDAGAHGVVVPMVNTAEDARKAVDAVKYPPKGKRGVGLARAQGYGLSFEKYKRWVNTNSIVVVQIEDIEAISNLEEILKVQGVDASIIGPYDLSASLGYPGEFGKSKMKAAIKRYQRTCKKMKKPSGIHVIPPDAKKLSERKKEGYQFIAFSLDTLFFGEKLKQELKGIGKA